MTDSIHEHLHDWLVAAANGSLTATERAKLAAHLAVCPPCRRQASDPALVEEQERLMERYGQFPAGLEERVLARIQPTAGQPAAALARPRRSPWWVAWRVAVAVLLAGLLAMRTFGMHEASGSGWASRLWGALLWVCLFVLLGQLVLDQWRRRHRLASPPLPGAAGN